METSRKGARDPVPHERKGILRRTTTLIVALTAALTIMTAAQASSTQLRHSRDVIRFFDNHSWLRAPNQPNCGTVPWTRTCTIARRVYRHHIFRAEQLEQQAWHTLPATNDWRTSVTLAQRIYPGTSSWLLHISDREGGWGPFVMNHQGSGAGGWLQFMASTFYAYVGDAQADVARRGFHVDPSVWTWTQPLGQALTGAYMRYTGRDGCHWCL
jgi:hypothetical protein